VVLLQGSGIFWAGDQRWELSEGGVAYLPRNVPHAYRFTSPNADMLAIATPAGIEDFFRAAGWDLSRPRPDGWDITQPAWPPRPRPPGRPSSGRHSPPTR
jgi:hypothetical protein